MKINVAICEDELVLRNEMEVFCNSILNIQIKYQIFSSGEDIINYLQRNDEIFHIYFLDIEMNNKNGIEVAKYIRNYDDNAIIIFVTSHNEYMPLAFDVAAFKYILKPISKDIFNDILLKAYGNIVRIKKKFNFQYYKSDYFLQCEKIIYFEKTGRTLNIYTNDDKYRCNMTLKVALEQLDSRIFVKISSSNIVNMTYIEKVEKEKITLENQTIIYVSQRSKTSFKACYMQFIKDRRN